MYPLSVATDLTALPGGGLIEKGLDDLENGEDSLEALVVSIGSPRLRALGIDVPNPVPDPEHRLYEVLSADHADSAHSRYNALVRQLVSFEQALACAGS